MFPAHQRKRFPRVRRLLRSKYVDYRYEGAPTPLFTDLNADIPAGQKAGFVGRSGSGKTTIVKLVRRPHEVTSGATRLNGDDIACVPLAELRNHVVLVLKEPLLFHRSLAKTSARRVQTRRWMNLRNAAERAGVHEFIERLSKGYGTEVGGRGVKLSGGEEQRVAIARAFLSDAPVLVMDEATSLLESEAEARVAEAFERLMEGRTTLVAVHRLTPVKRMRSLSSIGDASSKTVPCRS